VSGDRKLSAKERIEAAQKRRAECQEREAAEREEQEATDLEAIAELETEFGFDRIIRIDLGAWKPGMNAPASVAVRVPLGSEKLGQRWIEQINKSKEGSKERLTASDALAAECWVYPPKGSEALKAALELAPLIMSHAALQIVKASQGKVEDREKE
jgi:hypothetical protein